MKLAKYIKSIIDDRFQKKPIKENYLKPSNFETKIVESPDPLPCEIIRFEQYDKTTGEYLGTTTIRGLHLQSSKQD